MKRLRRFRLLRRFAGAARRLSAVHGRSAALQPHREGDRLHPEPGREADGAEGSSGPAGATGAQPPRPAGPSPLNRFGSSCLGSFSDRFILWQRVVVHGRGRRRTQRSSAGGSAHVLRAGLGEREGLRLRGHTRGTPAAFFPPVALTGNGKVRGQGGWGGTEARGPDDLFSLARNHFCKSQRKSCRHAWLKTGSNRTLA